MTKRFSLIKIAGCMTLLFMSTIAAQSQAPDYYGKHIIIAVDQSPDVQDHERMSQINEWLKMILTNQTVPSNQLDAKSIPMDEFIFNQNTDYIELFAFGIEGASHFTNDNQNKYINIKRHLVDWSNEKTYQEVSNALLTKKAAFNHNIDDYYNKQIYPLLSQQDNKYKIIKRISCVTFSYYVYPLILNHIEVSTPAEEYYLLMITNFKSGSIDGVNTEDVSRLNDWITNESKRKYIEEKNSEYENLYTKIPIAKYIPKVAATDMNLPIIVVNKLLPKQQIVSKTSNADIETNIEISQCEYEGEDFRLSEVSIKYDNPNVDKVELRVQVNSNAENIYPQDFIYENKSFILKDCKIKLPSVSQGDTLSLSYILYPNDNGKLPSVAIARQYHIMKEEDFVPAPWKFSEYIAYIISGAVLFLLLLGTVLYLVWKRRGKTRNIRIEDFRIWPISHSRYMEIKDKHVINYDCWYWNGKNDVYRQIQITGKVVKEKKKFAKQYKYRVEYLIADADSNADFSFRPSGRNGAGEQLEANKFYQVPFKSDGEFSFNADAYVDFVELEKQDREEPNFDVDNILEMKVTTKITIYDGNKILKTIEKVYPKYSFIVRPSLERPDLWVSFDLGTTGSCMAFGQAASLAQRNNIYMVNNRNVGITTDDQHFIPIFPSKIIIPENSRLFTHAFDIETAMENKDYVFGNRAEQHWNENRNRFQSIKKLLGYTTIQQIYKRDGSSVDISGQDLAFLLAKGIFNRFETDLMNNQPETIRNIFVDSDDNIQIERAIVAVPNNYMLNKVQEMVDSVKRLNKFKEVHYLYESEGVFMTYISKELTNLQGKHDTIFVVYDMGGATINITAFKIRCITRTQNGVTNISRIEVDTLAKVGYAVGGDDIDFAIIQFLYSIPSISAKFKSKKDKFEHQKRHKNKLIEIARKIKLDWIEKKSGKTSNGNVTQDIETFLGHIQAQLSDIGIDFSSMEDEDKAMIEDMVKNRTVLQKYVFEYVRDCTLELVNSLHLSKKENVELIMSGRSILYPGIKDNVLSVLNKSVSKLSVWKGFEKPNGSYDDEAIKTAVAKGACWYAMNGGQIELRHDIISFSFGYLDTVGGKLKFIPLIDKLKNPRFDEDGICASIPVQPYDSNIYTVDFVQMLGTNYDKIYDGEVKIPHKINILDRIDQSVITGKVESISVSVDKENNFDYEVRVNGLKKPISVETNPHSKFGKDDVKTEIADENSKAYTFAAVNTCDEHD